jgi:hypothetical protein
MFLQGCRCIDKEALAPDVALRTEQFSRRSTQTQPPVSVPKIGNGPIGITVSCFLAFDRDLSQ